MELVAFLFALSPIIVTIIYWVYKVNVRPSEKNAESTFQIHEEITMPVAQVAPIAVAHVPTGISNEDEIAVVLAAAANMYVKSTIVKSA
jgi:hypothetical protein